MEGESEDDRSAKRRMANLRRILKEEMNSHVRKEEAAAELLRRALQALKARAEENIADREKLANAKVSLKEAEQDLREALVVKSLKEAKNTETSTSLSATKARREDLRKTVEAQQRRKTEYESIISLAFEELNRDDPKDDEDIRATEDGILWYKQVLGFRIEGGKGVKFVFYKIDPKDPEREFTFTIQLSGDSYTMLQCCPTLPEVKSLLNELNQTNGLFKFVRTMRTGFQEAVRNEPSALLATESRHEISSIDINIKVASPHKRHSTLKEPKHNSSNRKAIQSKPNEALRRSPRRKANHLF